MDRSTLARLKVAAEGVTEETGDPGLDAVLSEIDLRVAVELAKAGSPLTALGRLFIFSKLSRLWFFAALRGPPIVSAQIVKRLKNNNK